MDDRLCLRGITARGQGLKVPNAVSGTGCDAWMWGRCQASKLRSHEEDGSSRSLTREIIIVAALTHEHFEVTNAHKTD
jgi:hypothetical protein